jgi:hypothetical protein
LALEEEKRKKEKKKNKTCSCRSGLDRQMAAIVPSSVVWWLSVRADLSLRSSVLCGWLIFSDATLYIK